MKYQTSNISLVQDPRKKIYSSKNSQNWINIEGQSIKSIAYQEELDKLLIQFQSGNIFEYSSVSYETFEKFLTAKSKGNFYIFHIVDKYSCSCVDSSVID